MKINEWQELGLIKDIESIEKKLEKRDRLSWCVLAESVVAALITVLTNEYGTSEKMKNYIFVMGLLLIFIPIIMLCTSMFSDYRDADKHFRNPKIASKLFVDLFDNKVCYWVMMSNSLWKSIDESAVRSKHIDTEIIFYYQEANYYMKKSVDSLLRMSNYFKKIISSDNNRINNGVDILRFKIIISELSEQIIKSSNYAQNNKDGMYSSIMEAQLKANSKIEKDIADVLKILESVIGEKGGWNKI